MPKQIKRKPNPADLVSRFLITYLSPAATIATTSNINAGLSVEKLVVPGETIPITLWFWTYDHSLAFGTSCTIKIYLLWTDPEGKATKTELSLSKVWRAVSGPHKAPEIDPNSVPYLSNPTPMAMSIGLISALIDPPPSTAAFGKDIFAIGDHQLEIEITTNGRDQGPYTGTDKLTVVYEAIDGGWWQWDPNVPLSAEWKESYTLAGKCVNKSVAGIGMDFSVTLQEMESGNSHPIGSSVVADLPKPETSPLLTFQSIKQDWMWLLEGIWVPIATTGKDFEYRAIMDITDEYGNEYSSVSSSQHPVTVSVSDKKIGLAAGAFSSSQAAAVLATLSAALGGVPIIGPALGGGLAAASAAAAIASAALGAEALDPPELDKRFLEVVRPRPFRLAKKLQENEKLASVGEFFKTLGEILNCKKALGQVEGKLLGACASANRKGVKLQKDSYKRIIKQMVGRANKLSGFAENASRSVIESGVFQTSELKAITSGKKTFPFTKVATHLRKAGLKKHAVTTSLKILADPKLRKLLLSVTGITRLFRLISLPVISTVQHIERDSRSVLKKYKIAD